MSKNKKNPVGVMYSTNPDFEFDFNENIVETLPNEKQNLKVQLDKKARAGKQVTLITGFTGTDEDLESLAKKLKNLCGCGGSSKDGEILLQGDFREKIMSWLLGQNYKVKKVGG
ncbi:MAG: translation initiation factor [Arcicella sp.]|nr:translation initiation factor [Arcicella sp.]